MKCKSHDALLSRERGENKRIEKGNKRDRISRPEIENCEQWDMQSKGKGGAKKKRKEEK